MIEFRRHTLANGLRIVHHADPSNPMVALNIMYNVGARDEKPTHTGLAHLFEHLMFAGSENIPNFDQATENAGGVNNAWTNNDFTDFYCTFPAVNAETAFWLESDRMLSLAFSQRSLDIQKSVVIEEFKQTCLDRPYGDFGHHLRRLLYTSHPYRTPTIGATPDHVAQTTLDDIRQFFYSHYAPNNAVLAVCGAIDFDRAVELAEKWFGPIGRRDIAPRLYAPEPPITSPREMRVKGNVPQTRLTIAFPMGGHNSPDYIPADLLTDILALGRSSRFYRELMLGSELFNSVDASIIGSDEPGALLVSAVLRDGSDAAIDAARRAIDSQLQRMAQDGPTPHELLRAQNRFESNLTLNNISIASMAQTLAQAETDGMDVNATARLYREVTPADIQATAGRLFDPSRAATLIYSPENQ